jgi:bacterioferritin (cytochrome b1)
MEVAFLRRMLIEQLRVRLAVEKIGVELYHAALAHVGEGGDLADRLRRYAREERLHAELLTASILELGGDPTERTPAVAQAEREATGLAEVCRAGDAEIAHVLHALLTAELAATAGWELLVELAEAAGRDATDFRRALAEEKDHVRFVRERLAELELRELTP